MAELELHTEMQGTSILLLQASDPETNWSATACANLTGNSGAALLTPVRLRSSSHQTSSHDSILTDLIRQTRNLGHKISALDRMQIVSTHFVERFAPARIFVVGDQIACTEEGWDFCTRVLSALEDQANRRVIAQLDYDQRRLHPTLGTILESIDFKTVHDPSAIATVTCFQTVLHYGISQTTGLRWAVKGAGEVGSRVIRRVLPEAQRIYVSDQSPERRSLLQEHASVTIVPSSEIADSPADALIFAADSGSLDMTMARNIAGNRHIFACGGPEAGLDRDGAAIEIVASAGKHYVPSVLCGSLGLISNLEEILGNSPDADAQALRLAELVTRIVDKACRSDRPFHDVCRRVLSGDEVIGFT